jgi:hypothetical protein
VRKGSVTELYRECKVYCEEGKIFLSCIGTLRFIVRKGRFTEFYRECKVYCEEGKFY